MNAFRGKHWDQYWIDSAKSKGLFEIIAKFYRRFIISPAVRYYFHKYFRDESNCIYLHSGCGSGESDCRIHFQHAKFVLMDISVEALRIAREKSKLQNAVFVCGDIFHPPFKDNAVDGVWNLGVMEHFYEPEIKQIFSGLGRTVKPNGTCLIFWPPKFGLSVIALTSFLFFINKFRKQPLVLYPDEVSRFTSKKWVQQLVAPASLTIRRIHFGIRDAFTYVIMVVYKK